jgi:hypothetical protein
VEFPKSTAAFENTPTHNSESPLSNESIVAKYLEKDITNTPLGKLTPEKAAIALLVELNLLAEDTTVFGQTVYSRLTNLRVGPSGYPLNLHTCILDFFEVCCRYETTEFAVPTFGSLYRTRNGKFDPNYDLFFDEIEKIVDEANFMQLLKAFITLLQAMYRRFFMTDDPACQDMARAVYFVKEGDVKHERRSETFYDFLAEFRRTYIPFCMISPDKREIRAIYSEAGAASKAFFEELKKKRVAKGAKGSKTANAIGYKKRLQQKQQQEQPLKPISPKFAAVKLPAASGWAGQRKIPVEQVTAAAAVEESSDESSEEETEEPPTPAMAAAAKPAETDDDSEGEFIVVAKKEKPKPQQKPQGKFASHWKRK